MNNSEPRKLNSFEWLFYYVLIASLLYAAAKVIAGPYFVNHTVEIGGRTYGLIYEDVTVDDIRGCYYPSFPNNLTNLKRVQEPGKENSFYWLFPEHEFADYDFRSPDYKDYNTYETQLFDNVSTNIWGMTVQERRLSIKLFEYRDGHYYFTFRESGRRVDSSAPYAIICTVKEDPEGEPFDYKDFVFNVKENVYGFTSEFDVRVQLVNGELRTRLVESM